MGKKEDYEKLIGRKFRPTFKSNIDHYEIRGYDDATEMVFTRVYPLDGTPFDDKIEEKYLIGAFETGDYEACVTLGVYWLYSNKFDFSWNRCLYTKMKN